GISEKALGPDHPDVAASLHSLAEIYRTQGAYAQAEPLLQRALGISEKTFGPDHSHASKLLHSLAEIYRTQGAYAQAEPLLQRALGISEKALGPDHPDVAASLHNLAALYVAKSDITKAIAYKARADKAHERNIALNLATGSERQKLLYLATLSVATNAT